MWNGGAGFSPISVMEDCTIDGQGHTITGLHIDRTDLYQTGFIQQIKNSVLKNIGFDDIYIKGNHNVGGMFGLQYYGNVTVENCYTTGTIVASRAAGGIGGYSRDGLNIINCHSDCSVSCGDQAGGIIGYSEGTIERTYATGEITGGGKSSGGLVGWLYNGTANNCYATGNVHGYDTVGGLIGSGGTVYNCYSTGQVQGTYNLGGLSGGHTNATNSYWNTETSGMSISYGGYGRTTDQMTDPYADNTYVGWDFTNIWINAGSGTYPILVPVTSP